MPIDPETVPPLTHDEVQSLIVDRGYNLHHVIRAAYALAASRVDTAEVERRAKYEALTVYRDWLRISGPHIVEAERVTLYRDRLYPAPAPRECVPVKPSVVSWHEGGWCKYDLADETGKVVGHVDRENAYYPLGTLLGRYITGNFAKKAVESAFAAEVGQ